MPRRRVCALHCSEIPRRCSFRATGVSACTCGSRASSRPNAAGGTCARSGSPAATAGGLVPGTGAAGCERAGHAVECDHRHEHGGWRQALVCAAEPGTGCGVQLVQLVRSGSQGGRWSCCGCERAGHAAERGLHCCASPCAIAGLGHGCEQRAPGRAGIPMPFEEGF